MKSAEAGACEAILRSLPDWFGMEAAIVAYRRDIESMGTYVAEVAGELVGFATVRIHNEYSAGIQVMAVAPAHHRKGIGRELVDHIERVLRAQSAESLHVQTLGPTRPDEHYRRTRDFYADLGFRPLEENRLWGEANPCLVMVEHLGGGSALRSRREALP